MCQCRPTPARRSTVFGTSKTAMARWLGYILMACPFRLIVYTSTNCNRGLNAAPAPGQHFIHHFRKGKIVAAHTRRSHEDTDPVNRRPMPISFHDWLKSRNIDQQSLMPELRAALIAQWNNEQRSLEPPEHTVVILNSEGQWPVRVIREAAH